MEPLTEALAEADDLLLEAEGELRKAIDACENLARHMEQEGLGENGAGALRMQRYILPHLSEWLYDENQMGSLASIRQELGLEE